MRTLEKRQKKVQARSSIDTSIAHRIAAGMTATKYNSKHRIVDEDVRDAQRRARAVAVAEEKTRLLLQKMHGGRDAAAVLSRCCDLI